MSRNILDQLVSFLSAAALALVFIPFLGFPESLVYLDFFIITYLVSIVKAVIFLPPFLFGIFIFKFSFLPFFLSLFAPLAGFLCSFVFSNYIGARGVSFLTTGGLFVSFFSSIMVFLQLATADTSSFYFSFGTWIEFSFFSCSWGFLFDSLAALMLLMVTSISFLVHFYSIEYMQGDPHRLRFMIYLSMFTFFMLLLVTADNLILLFLGWEGIGLCSYLLIGFWYTRPYAAQSALKAMVVNRVGDLGLMIAIAVAVSYFGTTDFATLALLTDHFREVYFNLLGFEVNVFSFFSFFLILGAVGKSAQIGLHTWLPDAMEGPTPVSALIHAATLVTAGIFLLARFSFVLEYSLVSLSLISVVGASTALLGATTGLFQYDIKRIIAYSTCSQLGYMFYACGTSNYDVALFHLFNHAYFKALLFLGAGSVIHALSDEQDIRKMGALRTFMPLTYVSMLVGTLSLCGFPYFSGFYSKDIIIEVSFHNTLPVSPFVYWIGLISAFCSSFYSFRLLYIVFFGYKNGYRRVYENIHEPSIFMSLPLFLLSFPSMFSGYLFSDLLVGLGTDFWGASLFILPEHNVRVEGEFTFFFFKLAPLFVSFFGAFFSISVHRFFPSYLYYLNVRDGLFRQFFIFLNKKWAFDAVYNHYIAKKTLQFSYFSVLSLFDRGFLEYFGPRFSYRFSRFFFSLLSLLQSGYLYHYIFFIVVGLSLMVLSVFFFPIFFSLISIFFLTSVFLLSYVVYYADFLREDEDEKTFWFSSFYNEKDNSLIKFY